MNETSRTINYFRSCFEADNRGLQLYSFFSKKVNHPKVLDDADLLNGKLPFYPVDSAWGKKVFRTLALYSKEKSLYYCAFYILGSTTILNRKQKLIAPLVFYPATIVEEEDKYQVELTSTNPILNPAAILSLSPKNNAINIMDELSDHFPENFIRFGEAFFLKQKLDELFTNLDTSSLEGYPEVVMAEEFDKIRKNNSFFNTEDQFHLIAASGFGILNKARSGRGVLNELQEMRSENYELSSPVKQLFDHNAKSKKRTEIENIFVPVPLNRAQQNLIRSSHENDLSIAIGPPGTGKSFTIAALTIDALSRGESILIASNNAQAVEVIADKLEHDFSLTQPFLKTTDKRWKAEAKQYLENILSGMGVQKVTKMQLNRLVKELGKVVSVINQKESIILNRTENEQKWGAYLFQDQLSFWSRFRLNIYKGRAKRVIPLWKLYQDLLNDLQYKNQLLQECLTTSQHYHIYRVLMQGRKTLQMFLKALRARTGNLKEERFGQVDFHMLFQALPIWLVTMDEVSQVLPLRKGLFDLVIFDEATQCNIASALPLLQRARRAVIVGDPKQLRHISFLSKKRQEILLQQNELSIEAAEELDYRNKSLLDFALDKIDTQESIHFLNEHYRSLPDLIAFSNKQFYNSSLHFMTDIPTSKTRGNLHLHRLKGKRIGKGHNEVETTFVIEHIKSIIEEEKQLPDHLCQKIGVLSPFREQSDHISKMVEEVFSLDAIQRHKILIGTPHFFQGEERDIMILSFALDDNAHPSAFRYLEKPDVFNVSITRARIQQHLLISFDPKQLQSDTLLRNYISSVSNPSLLPKVRQTALIPSHFMDDVITFLKRFDLDRIYQHYKISGQEIDIVVVHDNKTHCIDLVGYPGNYGAAFPLERIKMLERMRISVFSLSYISWHVNRPRCAAALRSFLEV